MACDKPAAELANPATSPAALTSNAWLKALADGPRSMSTPPSGSHAKACRCDDAVAAYPTICPVALTAAATLYDPPRVPTSVIPLALVQENACITLPARWAHPTTWPASLTAAAELLLPPSVPMSVVPPPTVHEKACDWVMPGVDATPTT